MKVNIKRNPTTNKFISASITDISKDDYTEIVYCLRERLEQREEKLEEFKDKGLTEYIPKAESEIQHLKRLINLMQ